LSVTTNKGTIVTPDAYPGWGARELRTNANGAIELILKSDTNPGTAIIEIESVGVETKAKGQITIDFIK
jgi:hypothetical protein